ncbi:MAG: cellulase family glycosylhydrolase [Candidatus Acidiferrum sp.]|jgi:polysaccharide biosynthesis protein PslG
MRLMFVLFLSLMSLIGLAAGQQPFVVGVCTHFGQNKGDVQANLSLIQQMSVSAIRDEVFWQGVERQKGQYAIPKNSEYFVTTSVAKGLKPLLVLDYGNPLYDHGDKPTSDEAIEGYARYAEFVVRHFQGQVSMYEIWNEWNGGVGKTTPGTPEAYVKLLKVVYPRLKAIDHNLVIIAGAVSGGGVRGPWLRQMLEAGALQASDAVSFHQYIFSSKGIGKLPETLEGNINRVEEMVRSFNGNRDFPLYLTETGWPTNTGPSGTTLQEAGDLAAQTVLLLRSIPALKGMWWYDFQDDGPKADSTEDNFGLVHLDLTPKPAFFAVSAVMRWMEGAQFTSRLKTSDASIDGVEFQLPDGQQGLAIWRLGPGSSRVQVKGASATQTIQDTSPSKTSNSTEIELTASPVWFTGISLQLH